MTIDKSTLTILLSILALNLSAQNVDSSKHSMGTATVVYRDDINAAGKVGQSRAVADSVLRVVSIGGKYNVGVSVVSRSKIKGKTPPDAIVHDVVTEVYQILEGKGVLIVGGTLDSAARIPGDNLIVLKIAGPSARGKHITGGVQYKVQPGDIVVIPPNTPHGFIELTTNTIVYTLIRIDSENVLELKN